MNDFIKRVWVFLFPLSIFLISVAVYANTFGFDFVYDDQFFTTRPDIRTLAGIVGIWTHPFYAPLANAFMFRPFTLMTFGLNYMISGDHAIWFHVTNVFLHAGIGVLLYMLLNKLLHNKMLSWIIALLFAVMPVHTEVVALVKARDELLSTGAIVLSWIFFLNAVEKKKYQWRYAALSGVCFAVSLLSKELLFFVPGIFFLYHMMKEKQSSVPWLALGTSYGIAVVVFILFRAGVSGDAAFTNMSATPYHLNPLIGASQLTKLFTAFRLEWIVLQTILFPFVLSASYHFHQIPLEVSPVSLLQAVVGGGILLGCVILYIYDRTKQSVLRLGVLIFGISSLITAKFFFPEVGEFFVERWQYFPSMGVAVVLGYGVYILFNQQRIAGIAILTALVSLYGIRTATRNIVWQTNETLYASMIRDAPNSIQGYKSLAEIYVKQHEVEKALPLATKANEIYPDNPNIMNLLGAIALEQGNEEEGEKILIQALKKAPLNVNPQQNLITLYARKRNWEKIIRLVDAYLGKVTTLPEYVAYWYATSLMMEGKTMDSLRFLERTGAYKSKERRFQLLIALDAYDTSTASAQQILKTYRLTKETALEEVIAVGR